MPKRKERPALSLNDDDAVLHAQWSRSGKRLIITVSTPMTIEAKQIELTEVQAETLATFLSTRPE